MRRTTTLWIFPLAFVVLLGLVAACGSAEEESDDEATPSIVRLSVYVNVSPEELTSMLEREDLLLVNVHIPYEGEIEGTDLFAPYDEIGARLDELPSQQNAMMVIYCRSGSMSAIAATTLASLGYTNIWNLDGGMIAWEEAGYQVVNTRP